MMPIKITNPPEAYAKKKVKKKTASSGKRTSPSTDELASKALHLLDQAASLLREGFATGAAQSVLVRNRARKRAHILVEQAHHSLGEALKQGTSILHKVFNKI